MDLELLQYYIENHKTQRETIVEAKRYYDVENNILETGVKPQSDSKDPIRVADNRIAHNFHQLLVDEKNSYLFTYPPIITLEEEMANAKVNEILEDNFGLVLKKLGINASNSGVAWLHYWVAETKEGIMEFKFGVVETEEIIPIYTEDLTKELAGIIRYYTTSRFKEGTTETETLGVIEYWNDEQMTKYTILDGVLENNVIETEQKPNDFGEIPYIQFNNNPMQKNDLYKYKNLIDLYDKVISTYANDIEDIQQIIYVLEGYGGESISEFREELKRHKVVKFESGDEGGKLTTLQIEIPVEARKVLLEMLKKQIYESGQGLQQDIESFGNASGVALKFFYRKLELKAGLMETEFRSGINKFIKAILKVISINTNPKITQTWTRNMMSNDLETSQIAQQSSGLLPKEIILRNHPWIENVEEAMDLLNKEEQQMFTGYNNFN